MSPVKTEGLGGLLDAQPGMVELECGGSRLAVHRAVLEASSPVLAARLRQLPAGAQALLALPDLEAPALAAVVAFMYAPRLSRLDGLGPQLLAAADRYAVQGLRAECERLLAEEAAAP